MTLSAGSTSGNTTPDHLVSDLQSALNATPGLWFNNNPVVTASADGGVLSLAIAEGIGIQSWSFAAVAGTAAVTILHLPTSGDVPVSVTFNEADNALDVHLRHTAERTKGYSVSYDIATLSPGDDRLGGAGQLFGGGSEAEVNMKMSAVLDLPRT